MGIGKRIRALRERACITQEQLAAKIGVTPSAVGNYERDVSHPREEVLYRLFEALSCQPNELFADYFTVSGEEEQLLMQYRALDSHGKELVETCTELEYRRCHEEEMLIAARNGGVPRRITLKKREGARSIFDMPDYDGGR